jgi:hypothetical protein
MSFRSAARASGPLLIMLAAAVTTLAQAPALPPVPGRLVDIGGRRLHLLCSGRAVLYSLCPPELDPAKAQIRLIA